MHDKEKCTITELVRIVGTLKMTINSHILFSIEYIACCVNCSVLGRCVIPSTEGKKVLRLAYTNKMRSK